VRHLLRLGVVLVLFVSAFALTGVANAAPGDVDNDTWPDAVDNCPTVYNVDSSVDGQFDYDGDGVGNSCDSTPGVPANESDTIFYYRDLATGGPLAVDPTSPRCATIRFDAFVNGVLASSSTSCFRRFSIARLVGADTATLTLVAAPPGCRPQFSSPITVTRQLGSWNVVNLFFACDDTLRDLPVEVLLQMVLTGQITLEEFRRALTARFFPPPQPRPPRRG
jgi:hypothetical protein